MVLQVACGGCDDVDVIDSDHLLVLLLLVCWLSESDILPVTKRALYVYRF